MEFQFYLLLPAVFTLAATGRIRLLGIISIIAFALGSVLHAYGWQNVFTFAPSFAAGMALNATRWRPRTAQVVGGVAAFVAVGAAMAAVPETYPVIFKTRHFWWLVSVQTIWTLLLVPLVAWNLHRASSSPPYDRMLGDLSFPFYLVHVPVTALVFMALPPNLIGKGVALIACLVATLLLYWFVDRPIERWRIGRRRRLAQAAAGA
jgi:peptidoglycan/LPS O-acetylase OafA/YrhL